MPGLKGPRFISRAGAELDLSKPDEIARVIASRPWSVVINAAAFTAVDKAETEVAAAFTLNALAPAVLAAETAKANIPIVHVSTDYVFSGAKAEPYVEDDAVGPLGVYGASKEGGEQGVRSANRRHAIIRTRLGCERAPHELPQDDAAPCARARAAHRGRGSARFTDLGARPRRRLGKRRARLCQGSARPLPARSIS